MSVKKKLAAATAGLGEGAVPPIEQKPGPRTAPGQMFAFGEQMMAAEERIADLEKRLQEYSESVPVVRLDPKRIRPSKLANRHAASFDTKEYRDLKDNIRASGTNVQPICVRPITGDPEHDYEIIYGHRRHRSCLDLNIAVSAMIVEATDQELFLAMDRENRDREDLTAYELALHYKRALDMKIWPTAMAMAEALGVTRAHVSQQLSLLDLPTDLIGLFPSPLDLTYRRGKLLLDALERDREGVMSKASEFAKKEEPFGVQELMDFLVGSEDGQDRGAIKLNGDLVGQVRRAPGGKVTVVLGKGFVPDDKIDDLAELISKFLKRI